MDLERYIPDSCKGCKIALERAKSCRKLNTWAWEMSRAQETMNATLEGSEDWEAARKFYDIRDEDACERAKKLFEICCISLMEENNTLQE